MWQRYNGTTKILEKSTDNGANWAALDLDAALITVGAFAKARQHAQTAYLDAIPAFSLGIRELGRGTNLGNWITPSYNSGDFTASSGTWTVDSGDINTYEYTLIGKTMILVWDIVNTDVSAAGPTLRLKIPGGFTALKPMWGAHITKDNGGAFAGGIARVLAAGTYVELFASLAGGGFASTSGDNTEVHGQLAFELT